MVSLIFREEFDSFVKTVGDAHLVPEGRVKKHVMNARDLRGEIGKQTILKDYDVEKIDVIHVLGAVNKIHGMGNVVVIESQGYKITTRTSGPSKQPFHLS